MLTGEPDATDAWTPTREWQLIGADAARQSLLCFLAREFALRGPMDTPLRMARSNHREGRALSEWTRLVPSFSNVAARLADDLARMDIDRVLGDAFRGQAEFARFLERCFVLTGQVGFAEGAFDTAWAEYVDALSRRSFRLYLDAPLQGFVSASDRLEMGHGVSVVRMSDDWVAQRSAQDLDPNVALSGWFLATHRLHIEEDCPREDPDWPPRLHKRADIAIRVLRLCRSGDVGFSRSWIGQSESTFGPGRPEGMAYGRPYASSGQVFEWIGTDDELQRVHNAVVVAQSGPRIEMAFQRFDASYLEPHLEDRILDYWIALEALLLPEVHDGIARTAAIRLALLVEPEASQRSQLVAAVKASYNLRSRIVHGEAPAKLAEIEEQTGNLVRRCLRRVLELGSVPSKGDLELMELGGGPLAT